MRSTEAEIAGMPNSLQTNGHSEKYSLLAKKFGWVKVHITAATQMVPKLTDVRRISVVVHVQTISLMGN